MLTFLALVLFALAWWLRRYTWFCLVPALVGALIIPLPHWWIHIVHSIAH